MSRGFKVVTKRKTQVEVILPMRGTANSAGYDFYSTIDAVVQPNEIVKIWTDVKAYMESDEVLLLNVRSSMGGKWMLANTIGVIDSDYYNNPQNEGNIGVFLKNISNESQTISINDKIAQGIFVKYLIVDDDAVENNRQGGFGSTGR